MLVIILLIVIIEITLRQVWGFCDAVLSIESSKYEYINAPNQNRYRFRCHTYINAYSQRSDEPNPKKKHILGLGDSVIDGGTWTDQDSIATSIFTRETGIQMLNISCGSWGPDNCAAYLKEKGLFDACGMVVVLSSHDAHDIMNFEPVVGKSVNYPKEQYKSAIVELFDRYLIPRLMGVLHIGKKKIDDDPDAKANAAAVRTVIRKDDGRGFNPGWEQLRKIAEEAHIPFAVYLHATKPEVEDKMYDDQGEEIMAWAKEHNVKLYKGIDFGECDACYFDNIHFNNHGQRVLADALEKICKGW